MKINRNLIALIVSLFLCFSTSLSLFANEESTQIEEVKIKVKSILRDPDSAKFQNIRIVVNSKAVESICGEVNARNAFGGYTGFSKFNVSKDKVNIVDMDKPETIKSYKLSGGAGPEAELETRLEDEALFSCNVIWNLLANVIVENQSKTEAIDAAIIAIKSRAKNNGAELNETQIQMFRTQYQHLLEQTLADKKQVRAIKKDPEYQKKIFLPACYANTVNLLKEQVKIKQ